MDLGRSERDSDERRAAKGLGHRLLRQEARETKIGDLKDGDAWRMSRLKSAVVWRLQEEILRFDITMNNILTPEKVQGGS
jgi:hypothetical protein